MKAEQQARPPKEPVNVDRPALHRTGRAQTIHPTAKDAGSLLAVLGARATRPVQAKATVNSGYADLAVMAGAPRRPSLQEEPTERKPLEPPKMEPTTEDQDRTGAGSAEGVLVRDEPQIANLEQGAVNEWNELDGQLTSDVAPHVFVNGGKTGSALDNTVGGRGGSGDQAVADITLVAPQYESRAPTGAGAQAKAWIRAGTGTATVTRSYTGSLTGANGPTLYMTAAAVARTDAHEVLHVQSSLAIHNRHIVPLEARIATRTGEPNALSSGATAAEAQTALQNAINWNATITAFQNDDRTANTPMGTVDTTDLASPTFIRDYGPRSVAGVNYAHYFDTPPGPPAGPTAPP